MDNTLGSCRRGLNKENSCELQLTGEVGYVFVYSTTQEEPYRWKHLEPWPNNPAVLFSGNAKLLHRRLSLIAGLDHWTGLLDWTTGLVEIVPRPKKSLTLVRKL